MSVKSKRCEVEDSEAIIGLYQLFARLLAEELNPEVVEVLLQPDVLGILSKAEPEVEGCLRQLDYESAAADFCDLFILPGDQQCSPRAVAWLEEGNHVSSDGIHAVVDVLLKETELELPPPFSSLTPDHASVLLYLAAELRKHESPEAGEFEEVVLGSWVRKLGKQLSSCKVPIYRALGKLIAAA